MSAWLSTSPLSTATMYGAPPACSSSSLFSGWQLASLMIPTLAHRVWPSTVSRASGCDRASRSKVVVGDRGAQGTRVVAELADLGCRLVHEAQAVTGDAHRAVLEQRIGIAFEQHALQRRCPTPTDRGSTRTGAGRPSHDRAPRAGRAPTAPAARPGTRPVAADRAVAAGQRLDLARPCAAGRVGQPTSRRAARSARQRFVRARRDRAPCRARSALGLGDPGVELIEPGDDADDQFVAADERTHAGDTLQQIVAPPH